MDSGREGGEEQVNILVKRLESLGVSNSAEQMITSSGMFCELVMKPLAARDGLLWEHLHHGDWQVLHTRALCPERADC